MIKKILITSILSAFVFSCNQKENSAAQNGSSFADSVIVEIQEPAFEANFSKVSSSGSGSADGASLFQRRGDLNYVLSELYHPALINFKNNPETGQHYKIDISGFSKGKQDSVKKVVRSKIKQELGYSTTTDSIMRSKYRLSVSDKAKLKKASGGSLPEGVESKIKRVGKSWNIIARLPRLAEILSKELNREVRTEQATSDRYRFKLENINDPENLKNQLQNTYGLLLEGTKESAQQVTISFKGS